MILRCNHAKSIGFNLRMVILSHIFVKIRSGNIYGVKPLPSQWLTSCREQVIIIDIHIFVWRQCIWKHRLQSFGHFVQALTHLPLVPHICVGKSGQHSFVQIMACRLGNAGLLPIGPLGTNFSEILIKTQNFSFMKMHLKISSAKWWPFCPGEMSWYVH